MAQIELHQKIEQAVKVWRENDYQGSSEVTKRLFQFWFLEEHFLKDGLRFEFWRCQSEAVEHLLKKNQNHFVEC